MPLKNAPRTADAPGALPALRTKALDLLARREFSRATLAKRLSPLADSAETLERLLDDLSIRQQLSDARYAENRVNARGRRYGNDRIAHELRQDGLDDGSIAAALANSQDEALRCQAVWQKRFGALPDTQSERARQQRFLRYRGFSAASIRQVLRAALEEDEAGNA
ncbi:MAG: recombination regulator RecX [Zoogloeaceae bacterium]|nr:recombination regulator RecX [Zoogloeaceae bacterium]